MTANRVKKDRSALNISGLTREFNMLNMKRNLKHCLVDWLL